MTSTRPPNPRQAPRARLLRRLGALAIVLGAGLLLAGCGRKGSPDYDTGEPVVKSNTNQLIPGLALPQKTSDSEKPKKPKGNFILDPLL